MIGVFSGGAANVWLSNPFSNPGGNVNSYDILVRIGLLFRCLRCVRCIRCIAVDNCFYAQ